MLRNFNNEGPAPMNHSFTPDESVTFAKEGLADVITTDFSDGYHDPILFVLREAIEEGIITLPRAVQLATSAPARIIPGVAPNRGACRAWESS